MTYGGMSGWIEQHMDEINGWMDGWNNMDEIYSDIAIDGWMDGTRGVMPIQSVLRFLSQVDFEYTFVTIPS